MGRVRPKALAGAALLLIALAIGIAISAGGGDAPPVGEASDCPRHAFRPIRDGFPEPPIRRSANGLLSTTLRATQSSGDSEPGTKRYDGDYPGATFVVCPGDTLRVRMVNHLWNEPTNLHLHGMHVSPIGNGDNVLHNIPAGHGEQYVYRIPRDQVPGMYWFHAHPHMHTQDQVGAGMLGVLIVEGPTPDDVPGIAGLRQRTLVITNSINTPTPAPWRVNGRRNPAISIRPGERQRWRILNGSSDNFVRLRLDGQSFVAIADDGNPYERPARQRTILMAPGERREVLVVGPRAGRTVTLRTLKFRPRPDAHNPEAVLAHVVPSGQPAPTAPMPGVIQREKDLWAPGVHVARRRVITYRERTPDAKHPKRPYRFTLNGRVFKHGRIDQTMKLGTVEEWTLRNASNEWHTFHIHQNPFQVGYFNGERVARHSSQDNIPLPPHSSTRMRTRFIDFVGRFVFHCHVLFHEDHGMMSEVQVVR